jgi:isocitrate/isopropylmalate dehydrogenase
VEFCGHFDLGARIIGAVRDCIAAGERTPDLGGSLDTLGFTRAVIGRLAPV